MEWYPLNTERMLSPEWLRIPPVVRAHFVSLEMYCAWRSNGGVIKNATNWTARDWDRATAIPKRCLKSIEQHGLVQWNGNDLVVVGYNLDQENKARRGREQRVNAAKSRWSNDAARNADEDTNEETRKADRNASRTPKESKENKGKKREPVASATEDLFPAEQDHTRVVAYLNDRAKRDLTPATYQDRVDKCLASKDPKTGKRYTVDNLLLVVDWKVAEWSADDKMRKRVNPDTLFRKANFGRYLDEAREWAKSGRKPVAQFGAAPVETAHDADGAPVLIDGDGELCTRSYS